MDATEPGSRGEFVREVERLAAAGDWRSLHDFLGSRDVQAVLDDVRVAYRFGEALFHTGRLEALADFAEDFERRAREEADARGLLRALNLAGIAAFELGRVASARSRFESLMEIAEGEDDLDMMARAANNLGAISNLTGHRREALTHYRLAAPLYERLGQVRGLAQLHHNLGITYRDLGDSSRAVDHYRKATALAEEIRYPFLAGMATIGRAEVELERRDVPLAGELVDRGLEAVRELGDPISEAEGRRVRAAVLAAAGGEEARIEEELRTALQLARRAHSSLVEAEVRRDLGRMFARRGDAERGRSHLLGSASLLEELGAEHDAAALRAEASGLEA